MFKRTIEIPAATLRSLILLAELVDDPAASDLDAIHNATALLTDGLSRPKVDVR